MGKKSREPGWSGLPNLDKPEPKRPSTITESLPQKQKFHGLGTKQLGLIVNPFAGIGGRVGLYGSDGAEIQERAMALGAVPQSQHRAGQALEEIRPLKDEVELITYPAEMGEDAARACGFEPVVIGAIAQGKTTFRDTRHAAQEMARLGVDLLLFAGGDGTARDVYSAIGAAMPVLGIPAGVKIHSAVYATSPQSAGKLALSYLRGKTPHLREAEVVDVDEDALRAGGSPGVGSARLYGYLKVPFARRLLQGLKTPSSPTERAAQQAIAYDVARQMEDGCLYVIGPGTTTRAITSALGLGKTLIGVDVVGEGKLVAADVNEAQLLELLEGRKAKIIVTPIGGQGCLFGRGNQQISPQVIKRVGRENVIVVSTPEKIRAQRGRPLWVDTGDREVDEMLSGYVRVISGCGEIIVYRVSC